MQASDMSYIACSFRDTVVYEHSHIIGAIVWQDLAVSMVAVLAVASGRYQILSQAKLCHAEVGGSGADKIIPLHNA